VINPEKKHIEINAGFDALRQRELEARAGNIVQRLLAVRRYPNLSEGEAFLAWAKRDSSAVFRTFMEQINPETDPIRAEILSVRDITLVRPGLIDSLVTILNLTPEN
jgi:hypothetical protein